jgi:hypothetical protein
VLAVGTTVGISAFAISGIRESIPESVPESILEDVRECVPESIGMDKQNDKKQVKTTLEAFEKLLSLTLETERKLEAASGDPYKLKAAGESALSLLEKLEDLQKQSKLTPSDVISVLEDYEKFEKAKGEAN